MNNVSGYNYLYDLSTGKTVAARNNNASGVSGSSGSNGINCASGLSGLNDFTWISSASASGVGTVADLQVEKIIDLYTQGNMTREEAIQGLKDHGAEITNYGDFVTYFSFKLNDKNYTIYCNAEACSSQTDSNVSVTYTYNDIKAKLNSRLYGNIDIDKFIEKYFIESVSVDVKAEKYAVNPETGMKTLDEMIKQYSSYINDLIMDNFLADINRKSDNNADYTKIKGKDVNIQNYIDCIDSINLAKGSEASKQKTAVVEKVIEDFTNGNLSIENVSAILKAAGAYGITITEQSTKLNVKPLDSSKTESKSNVYQVSFVFRGVEHKITCKIDEAKSGVDASDVRLFSAKDLETLDENFVKTYFYAADISNGKVNAWGLINNMTIDDIRNKYVEYNSKTIILTSQTSQTQVVKTSYKADKIKESFRVFAKQELQEKYNITDEYFESILNYSFDTNSYDWANMLRNSSGSEKIEQTYQEFKSKLEEFCKPQSLYEMFDYKLKGGDESGSFTVYAGTVSIRGLDILTEEGKINPQKFVDNLYIILTHDEVSPQLKYIANLIETKACELGLNDNQKQAFCMKLFKYFDSNADTKAGIKTWETEKYGLDSWFKGNNNGILTDEFLQLVNNLADNITVDNAKNSSARTVDIDEFLGNSSSGALFLDRVYELTLSNDPGVRKMANTILDSIKEWGWTMSEAGRIYMKELANGNIDKEKYEQRHQEDIESGQALHTLSYEEQQRLLKCFIDNLNYQVNGEKNIDKNYKVGAISKETLTKMNSTDFFKILEQVISTDNKAVYALYTVDSSFDYVNQQSVGDCWLLAGLAALNATEAGKSIVKNLITRLADGSVEVWLPGRNKHYMISPEELTAKDNEYKTNNVDNYSAGDNDVLALEIAIERLRAEEGKGGLTDFLEGLESFVGMGDGSIDEALSGGWSNELFKYLLGDNHVVTELRADDLLEVITKGFNGLFGIRGKFKLDESKVRNFLKDAYQKVKAGEKLNGEGFKNSNYAIAFSLLASYDATWNCPAKVTIYDKDGNIIDVKEDTFNYHGSDKFDGHVFGVVDITEDSISFANPWNSRTVYTVSWNDFINLGIAELSLAKIH